MNKAVVHIVRDHLAKRSTGDGLTMYLNGSEFLELASGVSYNELMQVMNEHMQALSVLQPKVYESLMGKIRDLRRQ